MNEGIFPSRKTRTRQAMEEERRLAFVALTRAEKGSTSPRRAHGDRWCAPLSVPIRFRYRSGQSFYDPPLTDEYKAESLSYIERMEEGLREDASSGIRFKAGDRIRHRVFGEGTVEEVQEAEQAYTIHFDGMMTARKIAFRVKMEKIR